MLENLQPPAKYKPCKIARIIDTLKPEDQVILQEALADKTKWSNYALAGALQERGLEFTTETLRAHRINICSCSRANR